MSEINKQKGKNAPRSIHFFGSSVFGDGECTAVYLGKSIGDISDLVRTALEAMLLEGGNCEPMTISARMMTDAEVQLIRDL